jgi:hypothetical protein
METTMFLRDRILPAARSCCTTQFRPKEINNLAWLSKYALVFHQSARCNRAKRVGIRNEVV